MLDLHGIVRYTVPKQFQVQMKYDIGFLIVPRLFYLDTIRSTIYAVPMVQTYDKTKKKNNNNIY